MIGFCWGIYPQTLRQMGKWLSSFFRHKRRVMEVTTAVKTGRQSVSTGPETRRRTEVVPLPRCNGW